METPGTARSIKRKNPKGKGQPQKAKTRHEMNATKLNLGLFPLFGHSLSFWAAESRGLCPLVAARARKRCFLFFSPPPAAAFFFVFVCVLVSQPIGCFRSPRAKEVDGYVAGHSPSTMREGHRSSVFASLWMEEILHLETMVKTT